MMQLSDEKKDLVFWIAAALLLIIAIVCLLAPYFAPYPPNQQGDLLRERLLPPSLKHPFGTDKYARDVFSRVLHGGRVSLLIALSVMGISTLFGTLYAGIAGFFGGWIDRLLMRVVDILLAIPTVFLIITFVAFFGSNIWVLILILGATGWMGMARLVRAEVLKIRNQDFIRAAIALGLPFHRILLFHIVPNILPTVLAVATIRVAVILLLESALSFLGLGVQPPVASWGSIIRDGQDVIFEAWWVSFFPGVMIILSVLALNIVGDALRHSSRQ
jgi:peptide/nickel transport system permease protein